MGLGDKIRSLFSRKPEPEPPSVDDFRTALQQTIQRSQIDLERRRYTEVAKRLEPLVAAFEGRSFDAETERITVSARSTLASALFELHRVEEAMDILEGCVSTARRLESREGLITALHELALCYRNQGMQAEAIAACEESAGLAAIDGEDVMPLYTLAIFRFEEERFEEARDLLEHARDAYENRHELVPLGRVFNELFLVTYALGDPVRAIEYARKSIELKLQIGDQVGAQTTMRNLMVLRAQHPELFPGDNDLSNR